MSSSISSFKPYVVAFLGVFALTIVGAILPAEIFVRRHVLPFDRFERAREIFRNASRPVVAFGDSHIADGVAPSGEVANFGFPGDTLASVMGKFDTYLKRHPTAHIILQAAPEQFSEQRLYTDQSAMLREFLSDRPEPLKILEPHLRRYLFAFVGTVLGNPASLWSTPRAPRAGAPEPDFAKLEKHTQRSEARLRIEAHTPVEGFKRTKAAIGWVSDIRGAVAKGAHLCLVTMPVSHAYREAAAEDPRFAETRDYFRRVATAIKIPYLDLWSAAPDSDFANVDHLNRAGAKAITRRIVSACFPRLKS